MAIQGQGMDLTACVSLVALCCLTFLCLQTLRFAFCKKRFNPKNPISGVFSMDMSTKCDMGFGITGMLIFVACACFILVHLTQGYHSDLLSPGTLKPRPYGARYG